MTPNQPETVVRRTVVVTDPMGLHIRIALAITKIVGQSNSQIKLSSKERQAAAIEVLQIMSLAVEPGEQIEIEAVGPDAAAVADALEPLFAGAFDDN